MEQKIVNLTPHKIVIYSKDKKTILKELPSQGVLRCEERFPQSAGELRIDDHYIEMCEKPEYTSIEPFHLLKKYNDHFLIVSMPVGLEFSKGGFLLKKSLGIRGVLGPDTGPDGVVRDESGRILGTIRLIRYI